MKPVKMEISFIQQHFAKTNTILIIVLQNIHFLKTETIFLMVNYVSFFHDWIANNPISR